MNRKKTTDFTVKVLVYSAVFAAMAAVLGQLLAIRPTESTKFTLDKFVLFLSGMFFGPAVGGMVGFVSDFAGGYLFGRGWFPQLCIPSVLYGVFGGLFRNLLKKNFTIGRLTYAYLFPTVLGGILCQSAMLALTYSPELFWSAACANLISRSIQFAIMLVVEVALIYILIKTDIFARIGLWPWQNKEKRGKNE